MDDRNPKTSSLLRFARAAFLALWALAIIVSIGAYLIWPDTFAPQKIANHLREYQTSALSIYLAFSIFRGLTLLPSTPLVLAGTLLFPHQAWLVLGISLLGIVASSSLIYWLSDSIGISAYFDRTKSHHVERIRRRLEHPTGLFFVTMWSFFPLVPTDAVCYVAGAIRMNFPRFIFAIFIGELVLCSVYVFGGAELVKILG